MLFVVGLPVTWPSLLVRDAAYSAHIARGRLVAERDPMKVLPRLTNVVRATRWIEEWHTMASGLEEEFFVELVMADGSVLWAAHETLVVEKYLERAGVKIRERRATHTGIGGVFVWMVWAIYVAVLLVVWRTVFA